MSLYDDLGVTKDASPEDIKKAFRDKAKKTHPDVGGDRSEFEKISKAVSILSDEDKRKRYDETGETEGKTKTVHQEAIDVIMAMFESFIANLPDQIYSNIVTIINEKILSNIAECNKAIEESIALKTKLSKLHKKFKKKKSGGKDILEVYFNAKLIACDREIERLKRLNEVLRESKTIINEYTFEPDVKEQESSPWTTPKYIKFT